MPICGARSCSLWLVLCCALGGYSGAHDGQLPRVELSAGLGEGEGVRACSFHILCCSLVVGDVAAVGNSNEDRDYSITVSYRILLVQELRMRSSPPHYCVGVQPFTLRTYGLSCSGEHPNLSFEL